MVTSDHLVNCWLKDLIKKPQRFYQGSAPKDNGNTVQYNINKYKMLKICT